MHDRELLALAAKVSYQVDPANPHPKRFTGHLKVSLIDGSVHEHRQGYFKGGVDHPLSDTDLAHKFHANCAHGGLPRDAAERLARQLAGLFERSCVDAASLSR